MVISSQALKVREGSETIPKGSRSVSRRPEAPCIHKRMDDDIVHPFRKLLDKCNQLVVGSNPTPGANAFFVLLTEILLGNKPKYKKT